jgi:hypothetical protein
VTPNVRRTWVPRDWPARVDAPVQLAEGVDDRRDVLRRAGGVAKLCLHVRVGSCDTDSMIEVLGALRGFLGGQKAMLLCDGHAADDGGRSAGCCGAAI